MFLNTSDITIKLFNLDLQAFDTGQRTIINEDNHKHLRCYILPPLKKIHPRMRRTLTEVKLWKNFLYIPNDPKTQSTQSMCLSG